MSDIRYYYIHDNMVLFYTVCNIVVLDTCWVQIKPTLHKS